MLQGQDPTMKETHFVTSRSQIEKDFLNKAEDLEKDFK